MSITLPCTYLYLMTTRIRLLGLLPVVVVIARSLAMGLLTTSSFTSSGTDGRRRAVVRDVWRPSPSSTSLLVRRISGPSCCSRLKYSPAKVMRKQAILMTEMGISNESSLIRVQPWLHDSCGESRYKRTAAPVVSKATTTPPIRYNHREKVLRRVSDKAAMVATTYNPKPVASMAIESTSSVIWEPPK